MTLPTKNIKLNGPISFSLTSGGQMAGGADTKVTICGRVLSYVQKANILTDTNDAWSVLDLHMLDIPDAKPEIEFLEELWQCLTKPYPAPSP